MSVLIKGMEMPKENAICVVIFPDGRMTSQFGVPHLGTAIPVPPHGDLIDQDAYRDEFMGGVYDLCNDDSDNNRANEIIDLYDSAPTIIPASEEGE